MRKDLHEYYKGLCPDYTKSCYYFVKNKKQKISTRNINNIKNRKPAWLKKPIKRCSTSLVFDVLSIETSFILCIILEIIKSLTVLSIGEEEGKQAPRLTASRSAK